MSLSVSVPEAAATPDSIQFKLVVDGTNQGEVLSTSFRSFQQINWVYKRLKEEFPDVALPPLPESPMAAHIDDQDYVERKRLQISRFFEKISKRKELVEHPDFIHFLSNDMAPTDVMPSSTGVLSFLKFNRVVKPDREFKTFKANEIIQGNDQDTFHKHQIYILLQETYFGSIAESLVQLIQSREALGDVMANMGDLVIETNQSKYRLGLGLKPELREAQRNMDRKMQMFGLLMDELGFLFTRRGKEENMRFGDVMIEYKNSMDPLKVVFNARTVKLIDYAEKLKHRNKKRDRADKLKLRLGMNHPEVKTVIAEETDATDLLDASRDEFDSYQYKVKQEIRLFERQKRDDVTRAIKNYVKLSIRYEQTQLNTLEKTLSDMQEPFTARQPFLGYQKMSPPSINSQAESSSSRQQKKRRQQHQNYKELHKTLQSSASLPTRNRRLSSDQEVSDSSESTQQKRDDHNNNRISLSASYDERLSTTHRFT